MSAATNAQSIFEGELPRVREVSALTRGEFDDDVRSQGKPVVIKNLTKSWPAVQAADNSIESVASYLKTFDVGASTPTFIAPAEARGRYFYASDMKTFNFENKSVPLRSTIDRLVAQKDELHPMGIYAGASPTTNTLPKFGNENPMPLLDASVVPKVWISNSAKIAAHFDMSENIACSVSGARKFVLFPPEQIANLYVGPIDYNMAGQPASMVDLENIDYERFPKFKEAVKSAQLAVLEPGDAIYIPSLWWHSVFSNGPLNVLVNYWWDDMKNGSPMNVLALALLVMRDLPKNERQAWGSLFQHYIFEEQAPKAVEHIPEPFRGVLGETSPMRDKKIKSFLIAQLSNILR